MRADTLGRPMLRGIDYEVEETWTRANDCDEWDGKQIAIQPEPGQRLCDWADGLLAIVRGPPWFLRGDRALPYYTVQHFASCPPYGRLMNETTMSRVDTLIEVQDV